MYAVIKKKSVAELCLAPVEDSSQHPAYKFNIFCSHKQDSVLAVLLLSFAITSLRICAHWHVCVCLAVENFFFSKYEKKACMFFNFENIILGNKSDKPSG